MKTLALTVAGILVAGSIAAQASTVASGFNTGSLSPTDDSYTSAQALGFTANFYGQNETTTFISNNGYVTFNYGQGLFTPTGLNASYMGDPVIAPFFADVDTRGVGTVTYGQGTYAGNLAFGATWSNVGYYFDETDKTDTFQVILVDRSDIGAGDFDIYFNYGQIQWESGDFSGGTDGLGGNSAAVGFADGTGDPNTYYQLAGSLVPGTFLDDGTAPLIDGTNDGVPGQYKFSFRDGYDDPPGVVPEPATLSLLGLGLAGLAAARRRRRV